MTDYTEMIIRLRFLGKPKTQRDMPNWSCVVMPAINATADALEALTDFANWTAKEVCCSDEEWENKHFAIQELLCRKLVKLGMLEVDGDSYVYEYEEEGER